MSDEEYVGQVWEEPDWRGTDEPWLYLVLGRSDHDNWRRLVLAGDARFVGQLTSAPDRWFDSLKCWRIA